MKFLLFLATQKGYEFLKGIINYDIDKIGGVFSFQERDVKENYFYSIRTVCEKNQIKFFNWKKNKNHIDKILTNEKITHIILIGWKYLLDENINNLIEEKMIVYHDSLLPKYRGFSPTPTAIINGEKEFGFSVIFAEKEMDSGDIIYQKRYELKKEYYIKDVINILSKGYAESIPQVIENLKLKRFKIQDQFKVTYSWWRDLKDMQIDWNKTNEEIYNFIRALGDPYLGAYTYLDDKKVIIKKAEVLKEKINFEIIYPGKFWKVNVEEAVIICGNGLLKVKDCYYKNGEKVVFKKLRKKFEYRNNYEEKIK